MDEKLKQFEGKKIDINCGSGAIYRGVVQKVDDGLLEVKDESDATVFISVKRVIAVTECLEPTLRPGFIA
jgi:hypothetical protein